MVQLAILSASFILVTFATSLIACACIMRIGVVDAPDGARKTQDRPIPRLGGLAMLLGGLVGAAIGSVIAILASSPAPLKTLRSMPAGISEDIGAWAPVFWFAAAAFLIGLWDDIWTANTKLKLALFALACIAAASMGLRPETFSTPWGSVEIVPFLIGGSALWLIVFTNAANFMDGSNGLAIGCLAIMLAALGIIAGVTQTVETTFWWFPLLATMAGFLMHNLRGQLYAGDAGSLGFGALFAGMGLVSGLEVWTVATLALPFLLDVLLTLIWRAKHGRNWLEAHLDHAYQRLIAAAWTHIETAVLYWGLTVTCAVLAYIGARAGGAAPFAVFWTLTLAGSSLWILHRRSAKRDNLSQ